MKSLYIGSMIFLSLNLSIMLLDSDQDSGIKHFGTIEYSPSLDKVKLIENVKFSVFCFLTFSFLGASFKNCFLIDSECVMAAGSKQNR